MSEFSSFIVTLAERLCAAYRSTYSAKSFSEILRELHEDGFYSDAEREAWCQMASLIEVHKQEEDFDRFIDDVEIRVQ